MKLMFMTLDANEDPKAISDPLDGTESSYLYNSLGRAVEYSRSIS